ncbi:MAG: dynamin family protein [Polaromonas sp.]
MQNLTHSSPAKSADLLTQSFDDRQREIGIAKDYVARTQVLFEAFGSAELKTSHARFPELLNALESNDVRLVVLGEFSRGKSYLLNSLLGIEVLPTATQTTTAINTFLKALPKGETERHILVHWQDKKREPQRVEWVEDDALERWGTELEDTHADVRKDVDHIELFLSHPLLDKGLVLVDTPGLQTIVKHHEAITRKAIAEAHIALFVQATDQLGGNQTEWDFMESTLKSNFQKFITVINKWDLVLEPKDKKARERGEAKNIEMSLQTVKDNFARVLKDTPNSEAELAMLTNENHLMGVSAEWAQSDDLNKRNRSGIDRLTARIVSMVASGEAVQQILLKPLQQLSSVQEQLVERIEAQLKEINSTDSLEVRRREFELQESKIKQLQADADYETLHSSTDHDRLAVETAKQVRKELIQPMEQLKVEVEDKVTESYVRKILEKALQNGSSPQVGLPPELDEELKRVQEQVGKSWEVEKAAMKTKLADLRAGYLEKMQKHAKGFDAKLGSKTIEMPNLVVDLEFDFSDLQAHQKQMAGLQEELDDAERKKNEIEDQLAQGILTEKQAIEARQKAQKEADRARRQIDNLGSPPSPRTYSEQVEVSRSGVWGWIKDRFTTEYEWRERTDDSNVREWRKNRDTLNGELENKKQIEERLQKEEEAKTGQRMSAERASKRAQQEADKQEKKLREAQQKQKELEKNMVADTVKKLRGKTLQQLDQAIKALDIYAEKTVKATFTEQAHLLKAAIDEKLLEPLNAEIAQKQAIQKLLHEGEAAIKAKRASLEQGLQDITAVHRMTQARLQAPSTSRPARCESTESQHMAQARLQAA